MVIVVGFTATLLVGGFQTLDGTLEVGSYSVLVFLTQRLLWPMTRLGETFDLTARLAEGEERTTIWEQMVGIYADFADYQKKTDRRIPVVMLEPR